MLPVLRNAGWTIAVLAVAAWGFAAPAAGIALNRAEIAIPLAGGAKAMLLLVGAIMALSGLALPSEELWHNLRRPLPILGVLAVTYVAFPAAGYGLAFLFFGPELRGPEAAIYLQGFMLLAAQTSTVATGIVLTSLTGGDRALAILITVTNYVASLIGTPAILKLTLGQRIPVSTTDIARTLFFFVILPLIAGQILRWAVPGLVRGRERRLTPISQVIILVFVLTATAVGSGRLHSQTPRFLAALVVYAFLLHAGMLALAAGIAWLFTRTREQTLAVMFCAGSKTLTSGTAIANEHFPENPFRLIPLAIFHVLQILVDSLLIPWLRRPERTDLPPPAARGYNSAPLERIGGE